MGHPIDLRKKNDGRHRAENNGVHQRGTQWCVTAPQCLGESRHGSSHFHPHLEIASRGAKDQAGAGCLQGAIIFDEVYRTPGLAKIRFSSLE
eukprot:3370820-Pleurochrysis_carterae.AAC.1